MGRYILEVRQRIAEETELSDRAWRRHVEASNPIQAWFMAAEALQFDGAGGYRAVILNKYGFPTGLWRDCTRQMMAEDEVEQQP